MCNKIKDNPTNKALLKKAKGIGAISKVITLFEKFGIKNEKISNAFKQVPDLIIKVNE